MPTDERYPYQVFACRGLTSSRCTSKSSPSAVYKSQARQLLQNARRRDFELGAELVPRARESPRNLIISHQAEAPATGWALRVNRCKCGTCSISTLQILKQEELLFVSELFTI